MTSGETIHVHREGRTAWVTLDRPPLNVLDVPMMKSLSRALARLVTECDFLVFQGAGAKGFSAGAEVRDHTSDRVAGMLAAFHDVFRQLVRADCLTLAAVHGHCLGGGMELATFCDFVIATESAQFGQPEIKLGCFPPVALLTLPELVGLRAALDLILTGRTVSATEACELGLVTRVVADDALAQAVNALLGELRALSPVALRLARRALWRSRQADFDADLAAIEQLYLGELMQTEDACEGVLAFLEKRAPAWKGR